MTTATEAPIETKAATPAANASAVAAASVTPPAGAPATTTPVAESKAGAPAAKASEKLLGETPATDPKSAETVKVAAITETKPADIALKAPDGVQIADADLRAIEAFAKENGLNQAQAEKILGRDLSSRAALKASQDADLAKVSDTWLEQTKALPEFAGDKLAAAVGDAKRAMLDIYSPEERKLIAESAFANHPLLLKALAKHGASLPSEDTIHAGTNGNAVAKSGPQTLYPMYYKA